MEPPPAAASAASPPSAPPSVSVHATIMLENVALLAGGPEGFERRYGLALHAGTFRRPGAGDAAAAVLHFLLLVIDGAEAAAKMAHCYPVLDKGQERDFRRVVEGRLVAIERAKMLPIGITRKSVVQSAGGQRFEMLVALLSTLALKKLSARHPAHAVTHNLVMPVRNSFNAAPGDYVKLLRMRIAAERVVFARTTQVGKGSADRFDEERDKLEARVAAYRRHAERLRKEVEAAEAYVGSEASGGGSDVSAEEDDRAALDALLQRFRRAAGMRRETEERLEGVERQEEEVCGRELNCRNGEPMDIVQIIAETTAELKAAEAALRESGKRERAEAPPDRLGRGAPGAHARRGRAQQPVRHVSDISCDSVESLEGGGGKDEDASIQATAGGSVRSELKDGSSMEVEEASPDRHQAPPEATGDFPQGSGSCDSSGMLPAVASVRRHRSILDMSVELTEEAATTAKLARAESRGLLESPITPSDQLLGADTSSEDVPRRPLLGVRSSSPPPKWTALKVGVANDSIEDMTLLVPDDDGDDFPGDPTPVDSINLATMDKERMGSRAASAPINSKADVGGLRDESGKGRSRRSFMSAMHALRDAPVKEGANVQAAEAAEIAAQPANEAMRTDSGSLSSLEDAADMKVEEGHASMQTVSAGNSLPPGYRMEGAGGVCEEERPVLSALSSAEGRTKFRGARAVRFAQLPPQVSASSASSEVVQESGKKTSPVKETSREQVSRDADAVDSGDMRESFSMPKATASLTASNRRTVYPVQRYLRRGVSDATRPTVRKEADTLAATHLSFDDSSTKVEGDVDTAPQSLPGTGLSSSLKSTPLFSSPTHKPYTPVIGRRTGPVTGGPAKLPAKAPNAEVRLRVEESDVWREESNSSPSMSRSSPELSEFSLPRRMFGLKVSQTPGEEKRSTGKKSGDKRFSDAAKPGGENDGVSVAKKGSSDKQTPVRRALSGNILRPAFLSSGRSKSDMKDSVFSLSNDESSDTLVMLSPGDRDEEEESHTQRCDSDVMDYSTQDFRNMQDPPPRTSPSPRKRNGPASISGRISTGFSMGRSPRKTNRDEKEKYAGSTTKEKLSGLRERLRRLG